MDDYFSLSALVFFAFAGVLFSFYLLKKRKARRLLSKAEAALRQGDDRAAMEILKKGLWKANETPELEERFIQELTNLMGRHGVRFDFTDYRALIGQVRLLSGRSTHAALSQLVDVQKLKKEILETIPDLPS